MSAPLFILNLGAPPPTGNRLLRMHWAARRRLAKAWRMRLWACFHTHYPLMRIAPIERARITIRWTAPQPPDEDNARLALKETVIDHLKQTRRRRVGGKMMAVPGSIPLLVDDDPDHLTVTYRPKRGTPANLTMEIQEA